MDDTQTIIIKCEQDILTARMRVREVARHTGMSLTDQSRISLATSSLANALGLGRDFVIQGKIVIEPVTKDDIKGVRVICSRGSSDEFVPPIAYFSHERWMVDDLDVKASQSGNVDVILTKWGMG